ncbi:short-chain dehydrogenase [Paenibacillus polymyxa]|uniref:SDR family oxidoreductase n=1 Tax=Paenibacillus polymyxa TaxID=1406 RepID=UPI00042E2229|nr:SDR family oxidoreductase [Paenibacillus polymyxa]AHM66110.1 short-chain dehydrogenase/reductase SDR [Paenibacillus polymyxa SQR-21]AIY07066.1 short-chain dehydrogenase [Paenibacillus polymyxa]
MGRKIAIITGANRGIGFEIAKQLGKHGVTVIMTARKEDQGMAACDKLKQEGLDVHFHQLDMTNESSIRKLAYDMREQFEVVDILVNNAGISIDGNKDTTNIDLETVRTTMETNVYGPLLLSQVLIPLMQESADGRIVNVSSSMGALNDGMGGGYFAYSMSKTALNTLTLKLSADLSSSKITVNSMCPGWVRTDMGTADAPRSVEQGADTAVWLATGDVGTTGKFFRDRSVISW